MIQPKSAKKNKRTYRLWKLVQTLDSNDISLLIKHRREMLKNCKDHEHWLQLRTEIKILEDAYKIIKQKEVSDDIHDSTI